ncbi:DUF1330 domain-containing protein [Mycobacterium sp. CBMA293]|uniref:DUF1330 domain-containing protein n=1 Tax=unclassified Mycolicibacterium TaxID=2636767 RepID=UPI0012DF586D|nr:MULTISPECIES: DUF1330 domain-containing protein [unclassified Mycolicibacterium]MUL46653.1 DUF1330 domain-containing protein [Mycolicibacterium sp. CBMA 360]MUL59046.1 DUF1330 domain-containing protein [Mycolicibacterium sp. CBMA 335]MUL69440.1 DUF1330 domain-containing protein [Mycolicibacterium sp. CBMA 311]MUL94404.1 DUF1330 domain-containing protein [Mycolicibacterium sp. CBMA 230]MUM06579.1 DUF1330 domain-containing protein [Mycolicibacterium sp. CBMA 213]
MSTTLDTTPGQFAALAARPADVPVVMVNLLQFKKPGGLERYLQYGHDVAPHLERVGARVVYGGAAPAVILGDGERPWWDAILIVEYPTPAAFIAMVTTDEYAKVHEHRAAALDRGDLIATSTWSLAN